MSILTDEEIANRLDGELPNANPKTIDEYRDLMRKSLRLIAKAQRKKDIDWLKKHNSLYLESEALVIVRKDWQEFQREENK